MPRFVEGVPPPPVNDLYDKFGDMLQHKDIGVSGRDLELCPQRTFCVHVCVCLAFFWLALRTLTFWISI